MNVTYLIQQFLTWVTIWSPIWAFCIWKIHVNGKKWCYLTCSILLVVTIYLAFNPIKMVNITHFLSYYTLFILIFILVLLPKFGANNFNKVLATSILIAFIAGEFWELPVFLYDGISKFFGFQLYSEGFTVNWFTSHIRRLYTLASFFLLRMLTGFRINKHVLFSLLLASTFLTMPIILSQNTVTIARMLSLYAFGLMALNGLKNG